MANIWNSVGGTRHFDFHSLVRHNRIAEVKDVLESRQVHPLEQDEWGNTMLCVAAQNGLKRMAKLALRHGGIELLHMPNSKGNTPLHFCYLFGFGDSLGTYLESKGADPDAQNYCGLTPPELVDMSVAELTELEAQVQPPVMAPSNACAYAQQHQPPQPVPGRRRSGVGAGSTSGAADTATLRAAGASIAAAQPAAAQVPRQRRQSAVDTLEQQLEQQAQLAVRRTQERDAVREKEAEQKVLQNLTHECAEKWQHRQAQAQAQAQAREQRPAARQRRPKPAPPLGARACGRAAAEPHDAEWGDELIAAVGASDMAALTRLLAAPPALASGVARSHAGSSGRALSAGQALQVLRALERALCTSKGSLARKIMQIALHDIDSTDARLAQVLGRLVHAATTLVAQGAPGCGGLLRLFLPHAPRAELLQQLSASASAGHGNVLAELLAEAKKPQRCSTTHGGEPDLTDAIGRALCAACANGHADEACVLVKALGCLPGAGAARGAASIDDAIAACAARGGAAVLKAMLPAALRHPVWAPAGTPPAAVLEHATAVASSKGQGDAVATAVEPYILLARQAQAGAGKGSRPSPVPAPVSAMGPASHVPVSSDDEDDDSGAHTIATRAAMPASAGVRSVQGLRDIKDARELVTMKR